MGAKEKEKVKYPNFPTRFRLPLPLECSGEISRKSVKSGYSVNSLKEENLAFDFERNAMLVFHKQLAPRQEIPHK